MTDSPIQTRLTELARERAYDIDLWCHERAAKAAPLPYASVDLRHSGDKLVPVDTNVFPAGFNNLSEHGREQATLAFGRYLKRNWPEAERILILPENHTRNQGYLDNLATLGQLIGGTGRKVAMGRADLPKGENFVFTARESEHTTQPLHREGGAVVASDGFRADLILLNNDLSAGVPPLLEGVTTPIVPPLELGWWKRRKSMHFAAYDRLAREFAEAFGLDPWTITTGFRQCGMVNFKEQSGLECVALGVEAVLHSMREKYREHGVEREAYAYVKADSGTYGMGIMIASSGEEAMSLNKKTRNKMDVVKEGQHVSEVMIQEGVPTIDTVEGDVAEPVVYLVDGEAVGSVWRVNGERTDRNNLNAAGMRFVPAGDEPHPAHALVARLAALAAARE